MQDGSENQLYFTLATSPLGQLLIAASDQAVHHILFEDMPQTRRILEQRRELIESTEQLVIAQTCRQLEEYFCGRRQQFDLPLGGQGTAYQQKVWAQLCKIPYATTWNYAQLAQVLGQPNAARAVGMANGRNPLSIVVPCHRVIGKNRQLTGYAGGLERKAWLLAHEAGYNNASSLMI